jgi:RNA polymerase sigma-70 factor (ECF subfamily)
MTDAELVARVVAGERGSFDELADRHFADCLRYARHMLRIKQDAEDAVQETFVRAYRALSRYDERHTFRSWLFRILINRCRSLATARGRRDARLVYDERALLEAPAVGPAGRMDDALSLSAALATLDPRSREAFLLRYGEGLDYVEMARLSGDGISALKMRVKRARERMRSYLGE